MPNSMPILTRLVGATLGTLLAIECLLPGSALAKATQVKPPTSAEVAGKRDDLKALRGQIRSLRKGVANAEVQRANVADQLKGVEQEISATLRTLHDLTAQRLKQQEALNALGIESGHLESRLDSQQSQLEELVYRQYLLGRPDSLRLLLKGDDPNQMARDLHYLTIIGQTRSQLLSEIRSSLQRKQAITAETRERAQAVAAIEAKQKEQHDQLVAQREKRKLVLESISTSIKRQQREIGNLLRDERQLASLIARLAKSFARKPVARENQTAQGKPQGIESHSTKSSTKEILNENTPEAGTAKDFAHLKGTLRLPVRGVVGNRFGGPRQEGSTWKGLFIRANQGGEVKAIAAGRVVFADWMRGFGNLMIIDHGSSYLSIYGNNDALLKQVGDSIHGGDTIASVGNSGGNLEYGLYFELRRDGQPLDPLRWVNLK